MALLAASVIVAAQEPATWRISPVRINIQIGEDRPLQLLDANAREPLGASWSVDNPDLAELETTDDGRVVLHPKAMGTVRVTAAWNGEMHSENIKIWSAVKGLPPGATRWGVNDIGREIRNRPAVPTGTGPNLYYSLEQNRTGETYLRALSENGIQIWR